MKAQKDKGEELIDVDDKGNPIEKEKEKEKKKGNKSFCKYITSTIIICLIISLICCYFIKIKSNNKNVFDETTLKKLHLKNRVFFGPIIHDASKIEEIVKNNVSLVVTDGAIVGDYDSSKKKNFPLLMIDKDDYIPEIKNLADIVHKYNSYILLDLVHLGLMSDIEPIYSPSVDKGFMNKEIESKSMTKEDILRIQNYFVQGAIRAKKAGYDGVEIHGAHLTLVSLFSSKKYNRRTDEYGGSDENRARFLVEIVKKIREAVGEEMIISAKIDSPDEINGITESGFFTFGKLLEEAGLDLIEISGTNPIRNDEDVYFYNDTKKIADVLKIPVVCIGGIKKYEQADFILKNSRIEYIALSRELLKQPDMVKKWYLNK